MEATTIGFIVGTLIGAAASLLGSRRVRALFRETLWHPTRPAKLEITKHEVRVRPLSKREQRDHALV
jgi:hypothetical protein